MNENEKPQELSAVGSNLSAGLGRGEIPDEIIKAAFLVGRWFDEHGAKEWALGPCASRRALDEAKAWRERFPALYYRSMDDCIDRR